VVRLPRRPDAAAKVAYEASVLDRVGGSPVADLVAVPTVRHRGRPHPAFPHGWTVLDWLPGDDAWAARGTLAEPTTETQLSADLASVVAAIGRLKPGPEFAPRTTSQRGGSLPLLLDRLDRWLIDPRWNAADLIDVAAVQRVTDQAREVADEPVPTGPVHGDLIPGNLLVSNDGTLSAVIDWGGAGIGDRAQDLAPAWSLLSAAGRPVFRSVLTAELGLDDADWIRARAIELEHAVGGVLYYRPKGHVLGDIMATTLDRILTDG
jgi:aminoglycoside phosphotransferase (APT) family kinase protein